MMEEMNVRDASTTVHFYWKDILRVASISDEALENSVWDCDYELLDKVIKSFSPVELSFAFSEDETVKFLYMQKIWYRYLDVRAHRSILHNDFIEVTADSSITELDISSSIIKNLKCAHADYLWQVPDVMSEDLTYAEALDVAAAVALLETRRYLC